MPGVRRDRNLNSIAPLAADDIKWTADAVDSLIKNDIVLIQPATRLTVTELVAVRPPDLLAAFLDLNGYLPIGVPMLKRVLALPGQAVCRNGLTIAVDGVDVGEAHERDGRGRLLPVWHGCRVIADGDVFIMNWQSADSLDGRYFGPLPASAVIGRAVPVWTNEE